MLEKLDFSEFAKFEIGQLVATPSALNLAAKLGVNLSDLLTRHARGDWGDLSEDDKKENDFSVSRNLRIFSSYIINGEKFWIITEADRSSTCILLPEDY